VPTCSVAVVEFAEVDYLMRGDGSTYSMPWSLQKLEVRQSPPPGVRSAALQRHTMCSCSRSTLRRCGFGPRQVLPVWNQYTFGDCSVAVCHIDSGIPWGPNHWYNPGEYAGILGVDDDGNGVLSKALCKPGYVVEAVL
jgi:hypothetical protein